MSAACAPVLGSRLSLVKAARMAAQPQPPASGPVPVPPPPQVTGNHRPLTPAATGFGLFLAALWGGNPSAIKVGLEDAGPLRLAGYRFVAGGIVTIAWALATKQSMIPTRRDLPFLGGLAVLFSAQIALMNIGQDHTTASHASVIGQTFPLWTGVIAHFVVPGDRLTMPRIIGTLVAYLGVVAVVSQGFEASSETLVGDVLMVGSAILLGSRLVYTSMASQSVAMPKLLMTQVVVGIVVFLGLGAVVEDDPWVFTDRLLMSVLYQGVIIAGFGFIANMWMLKNFLPSGVAALSLSTPIWGVIIAHYVLGDDIGPSLFLGVGLVVAGMSYAHVAMVRQQRRALREGGA